MRKLPVLAFLVACGTPASEDPTDPAGTDVPTEPIDIGLELEPGCWPGLPVAGVVPAGVNPEGVRLGPDCAIYVVEADSVWRIGPEDPSTATLFASDPSLTDLQGLDFDDQGRLYVASRQANAIGRFSADGTFLDLFATTTFDGPNTPLFGPDGNLYVSSRNTASIVRFAPDGTDLGVWFTDPLLDSPEGMAFAPDGSLVVSSRGSSTVYRVAAAATGMATVVGAPDVMSPEGVRFASDGTLWVASRDDARVLQLSADYDLLAVHDVSPGRPIGLDITPDDEIVVALRETGVVRTVP